MDRTKARKSIDSHAAHKNIQKSTTLNRRYVHKPSSCTKIKIDAGDQTTKQTEQNRRQPKKIAINSDADEVKKAEAQALAAAQAAAKAAEEAAKKAAEEQAKLAAAEAELSRLEAAAKAAQVKATQAATLNSLQNDTTATYQPLTKKQLRQMDLQDRMHAEASVKAAQIAQKEMAAKNKQAAKAQAAAERQMAKSRKMVAKQTARALKKSKKGATQTVALSQVAKKLDQGQHITKMQRSMRKASAGKRFFIAFSASAAVVAVLGLIVRFNMPDVSVRVAAMQTGIEATYPTYIPRGYQLNSVTTDKENGITMEFSDSEKHTFTINEKKSSWDSNALLNNYVKERWGSDYTALREHGITIYVSDGNATWVNGGLVYNLASDTGVLTKKQIKNIVTSL